ncbi:MAG: hypothetical protein WBA39_01095 [Rivularia sp. (in: cyanobacteria)]
MASSAYWVCTGLRLRDSAFETFINRWQVSDFPYKWGTSLLAA